MVVEAKIEERWRGRQKVLSWNFATGEVLAQVQGTAGGRRCLANALQRSPTGSLGLVREGGDLRSVPENGNEPTRKNGTPVFRDVKKREEDGFTKGGARHSGIIEGPLVCIYILDKVDT